MSQTPKVIIYTNHQPTIQILTSALPEAEVKIPNRSKTPVEEISSYPPGSVIVGVMPLDSVAELTARGYRMFSVRLDGKKVETLTGRPYNPKEEYPPEIVRQALVIQKIVKAEIRYMSLDEFLAEISHKTVAVFNDVMREALGRIAQERGIRVELIKQGKADVVIGIPPTMIRGEGIQISFPGTTGQLTAEQMASLIKNGQARIYWVSIDSEIIPLEQLPQYI